MADVISRLRLDSGEFDSKIKRAGQELLAYGEHCKKMGLEMGYANKDAKEFAKALGDMKTVSQTARGKLSELTEAFTNLKAMYNQMTDDEKQNTFGKELAASLDKLKTRINEAKENLNSVNAELGNTKQAEDSNKSGIDALTSALGINIKSLVGWGAALGAAKMALDVAKDAIMSSETNVDDWGRTVRSAESIYQSFLQSLNTGNFSGFLNNIGQVTQAARDAYNALDELGTRMTIINPERARLQARQQELRATIRRNGADSEAGKAALAELKKIEPMLAKSFGTESKMNYNAFEKLVRERLAQGGINLNQKSFNQFMKTFSSDAAFQNLRKNARGSSELKATSEVGKFITVDTRNTEQKLLDLFTDEWRQANSGFLTAAFNAKGAAASNALGNARYMRTGGGGGGGRSGGGKVTVVAGPDLATLFPDISVSGGSSLSRGDALMQSIRADMGYQNMAADQTSLRNIMAMAMKEGLDTSEIDANGLLERIFNGEDIPTDFWNGLMDRLNEALQDFGREAYDLDEKGNLKQRQRPEEKENIVKQDNNALKQLEKFNGDFSKVTGGVSSIVSGIQQMGVDIPEEIQSVLGVLTGISSIITGITSILGLILVAEQTTAAASWTDAIVPFASGGIIKAAGGTLVGNSYSGDNLRGIGPGGQVYGLNAGEVVLNRSQASTLASALSDGGNSEVGGTPYVQGELIYLGVNNYLKRSGRGEIVTSKRG